MLRNIERAVTSFPSTCRCSRAPGTLGKAVYKNEGQTDVRTFADSTGVILARSTLDKASQKMKFRRTARASCAFIWFTGIHTAAMLFGRRQTHSETTKETPCFPTSNKQYRLFAKAQYASNVHHNRPAALPLETMLHSFCEKKKRKKKEHFKSMFETRERDAFAARIVDLCQQKPEGRK